MKCYHCGKEITWQDLERDDRDHLRCPFCNEIQSESMDDDERK